MTRKSILNLLFLVIILSCNKSNNSTISHFEKWILENNISDKYEALIIIPSRSLNSF